MLNTDKHDLLLKQILKDIFKHKDLQGQISFKGGTCLYLFHDLNRFSTDLDMNLISDFFNPDNITTILEKYLHIDDFSSKKNTWFWLGSYEKDFQKIKVEISKRDYPDEYENSNYLGITIPTMKPEFMFAHKLCAITDRKKLQNRDLFDSLFMFNKQWEPNKKIIKIRTGLTVSNYYKELISFIKKNVNRNNILDGLGEVINEKQKYQVKNNLIDDLLFQLEIRIK